MSARRSWMIRTLAGKVVNINDEIDAWHDSPEDDVDLPTWLGMTGEEYDMFFVKPHALPAIVARRHLLPAPPPLDLSAPPAEALGLSSRADRVLTAAGILSVAALLERTAIDLLKIRGCGMTTLDEIRAALARHGLALAGEPVS